MTKFEYLQKKEDEAINRAILAIKEAEIYRSIKMNMSVNEGSMQIGSSKTPLLDCKNYES